MWKKKISLQMFLKILELCQLERKLEAKKINKSLFLFISIFQKFLLLVFYNLEQYEHDNDLQYYLNNYYLYGN